jgi:hypothetical protein
MPNLTSNEGSPIATVNGYQIVELQEGGLLIVSSDGVVSDELFATLDLASDYALTLEPAHGGGE